MAGPNTSLFLLLDHGCYPQLKTHLIFLGQIIGSLSDNIELRSGSAQACLKRPQVFHGEV